jgi:hypothetical protein
MSGSWIGKVMKPISFCENRTNWPFGFSKTSQFKFEIFEKFTTKLCKKSRVVKKNCGEKDNENLKYSVTKIITGVSLHK